MFSDDILRLIANCLPEANLPSAMLACKQWHLAMSSNEFWEWKLTQIRAKLKNLLQNDAGVALQEQLKMKEHLDSNFLKHITQKHVAEILAFARPPLKVLQAFCIVIELIESVGQADLVVLDTEQIKQKEIDANLQLQQDNYHYIVKQWQSLRSRLRAVMVTNSGLKIEFSKATQVLCCNRRLAYKLYKEHYHAFINNEFELTIQKISTLMYELVKAVRFAVMVLQNCNHQLEDIVYLERLEQKIERRLAH